MKIFKYVLMCIFIATTITLSGCGGDKFEGTWYGIKESSDSPITSIEKLVIEKNGENYIIKPTKIFYIGNYKKLRTEKKPYPAGYLAKYYTNSFYGAEVKLTFKESNSYTAVAKNGKLGAYTYIEKDGSLVNENPFAGNFTYRKCNLKDVLPKLKEGTQAVYERYKTNHEDKKKLARSFMTFNGKGLESMDFNAYIESYNIIDNIPTELQ